MAPLVTERDLDILAALERFPMTAQQLLKLSRSFACPFTDERRVRERLLALVKAKRIRQFRYAIAGPGSPAYYLLNAEGHQLLRGPDALPPSKRAFSELSVSRQAHAFYLAEFLVHFMVQSQAQGHTLVEYEREHRCVLRCGEDAIHPDAGFQLRLSSGAYFRYYVEIDNSTERVRSSAVPDTWERKVRLYERYAESCEERFRVLVVTTKSEDRLHHILRTSNQLLANKQKSLVSGTYLPAFLSNELGLEAPCFLDHHERQVPLILPIRYPLQSSNSNFVPQKPLTLA
ncbi:MAG TPA: replication-relaxation family protein [Gemmatales bacterium]|nr:replication-relaxation family protein [Gemmatales bacterium]